MAAIWPEIDRRDYMNIKQKGRADIKLFTEYVTQYLYRRAYIIVLAYFVNVDSEIYDNGE